MAKKQFLDQAGLEELVNHIPVIVAGDNITITPDETKTNKVTISSKCDQSSLDCATNAEIGLLFS